MKRPRLTESQREEIAVLRGERGWTISRIAGHLGASHGAVAYRCLIEGIEKPGQKFPAFRDGHPMVMRRGAFEIRRFAPEDDARLLELESAGLSQTEIGRQIGRRANSVKGRLATLARREERALARSDSMPEEANGDG